MSTFGLTPQGFVPMMQQDIIAQIYAELQSSFGQNINLAPNSIFSQFTGIYSGREALLWQLAEAVYASQYPNGAEGTSVDNILALSNLKRLPASATETNSEPLIGSNGVVQYGLVLLGIAGTSIPFGSIIQTQATPPLSFTLTQSVTIASASNAVQQLLFNGVPTSGTFQLSIQDNNTNILDANGNVVEYTGPTLTTIAIPFNALASQTQLNFSATPASSTHFALTLTQCGNALTTALITTNGAYPTSGAIQSAITALTGYSGVTVSGSAGAYTITWGSIINPVLTVTSNTTTVTISKVTSIQTVLNNLHDSASSANPYPYSDVTVTGSFAGSFIINFGSGTPIAGSLSSGSQPQSLMTVPSNTLFASATAVTTNVLTTTTGAQAQGIGVATCTATGPNAVVAGTLNTIGSPVSGWSGVTNQLDCLMGSNVESDTQALIRRATLLAAQANGPLQATIAKVKNTTSSPPITAVLGFQNLSQAALQILTFVGAASPGNTFIININGTLTGAITINNNSGDAGRIQTAIQAVSGYSVALVSGTVSAGFTIDWNGSVGGQPIPLVTIQNNSTGSTINPSFGRPGKSIEIVVQGGGINDIAEAIFSSNAGGIQTYGIPVMTTGNTTAGSATIASVANTASIVAGMLISGTGILPNTTVVSVSSNSVVMSQSASASGTGTTLSFSYSAIVFDIYGNSYQINFSRPTEVPIYVTLSLTTDLYNTPGNPASGLNSAAQFSPGSISQIIADLIAIGNAVPIGGRVVGFGSDGLVGSFNNIPGIVGYTLYFDIAASPAQNSYIQLLPEQIAVFESLNVLVSYA